jgi:membrane protein DedA with SNARE-associated domain
MPQLNGLGDIKVITAIIIIGLIILAIIIVIFILKYKRKKSQALLPTIN